MADNTFRVNVAVKDANLAEKITGILRKDRSFQLVDPQTSDNVDLTIYQLENVDDGATDYIETLLKSDRVNELFLVSESTDPFFLMQIMRLGVKEFFPLPFDENEFQSAIERFKERAGHDSLKFKPVKQGEIITVVGSKGGVGATTVAVNTAVALSEMRNDYSVALVDLNSLFGDIPLFLDITPKFDWGEITKNIDRLDNLFLTNVMSKHNSGVHLLPSPSYLNGHQSTTPEIIDRLLNLMRNMFDFTIVDCGQSLDASALRALELSDRLLLVAILSMPCLTNTNKLIRSLVDMGHIKSMDRLNVVINRALKSNEITVKDAEAGIGKKVFWVIPNDYRITMAAINSGKPILHIDPKSQIAKNFLEMTRELVPKEEKKKKRSWSLFKR
jgi:pilus assembly protein CpaE